MGLRGLREWGWRGGGEMFAAYVLFVVKDGPDCMDC